ncbi:MAG: O-antigen ligase family protein [Saprospiraceae bacterium]
MPNSLHKEYSLTILAYTAFILLLTGFLLNRVINNIGLLLAGFHAVLFVRQAWKETKGSVLYALLGVILFPTIHDLIFHGMDFLHPQNTMKWSLIVYPLFFASCTRYTHFLKRASILFIICLLFASAYSMTEYLMHFKAINEDYGKAKVMKVLAYSDHIRLSWATVISIVLAFYWLVKENNTFFRNLLGLYILFQFTYLHILGAKTGLLTLYLTTFILVVGYIFQKNRIAALGILVFLMLSPFLAYKFIPSFQNRVKYMEYEMTLFSRNEYQPGLSDALRIYSLKAGLEVVKQHLIFGVGYAKIQKEIDEWYRQNTPFLSKDDYFLPISQFLLYWAAGGILGLLLLLYFVGITMYQFRKQAIFLAFFIPVSLSFVYENHLETQTGVFVFGCTFGLFFVQAWQEKKKELN